MNRLVIAIIAVLAVIVLGWTSLYTIDPTNQAVVIEFGKPIAIVADPGLHFKLPYQEARIFDRRLLIIDAPSEEVIAEDKKRLVVDAFARWRITDPLRFYQTLADETGAQSKLVTLLASKVRDILGSQKFSAVLSAQRAELMRDIRDQVNREAKGYGVAIVDVRIRHADLPQANSEAIYQRMKKERQREASEYRAEGDEIAQRVRARAEREAIVIKAEATRESEILRGQGDAEKTRVLADAYGQDPGFFSFYRSMQAYRDALPPGNTTVFLSPKSDFFRYFGSQPEGR